MTKEFIRWGGNDCESVCEKEIDYVVGKRLLLRQESETPERPDAGGNSEDQRVVVFTRNMCRESLWHLIDSRNEWSVMECFIFLLLWTVFI